MKRLALIIIVGVSSAFISMCGKDDIIFGHTPSLFEGFVLDSATLTPIESVKVTVVDTLPEYLLNFTDTIGFFDFEEGLGNSKVPVFFRKGGYFTALCTLKTGRRDTLFIQKQ
ncbi:hypothetical protein JYU19_00360 [bacterium AH-315-J21]|nr:hypothetical protein [bacterium AH-315-J21]